MILISISALLASGAVPAQHISGSIRDDDYPASAWKARDEGTVVASFIVGPDGSVTSCEVVKSSGHASLDSVTCSLIQERFRFRPAVNADGETVEEQKTQRVTWRVPSPPPESGKPAAEE